MILCSICGHYDFVKPKPTQTEIPPEPKITFKTKGRPPQYRPAKIIEQKPPATIPVLTEEINTEYFEEEFTGVYLDEKTGKFTKTPPTE